MTFEKGQNRSSTQDHSNNPYRSSIQGAQAMGELARAVLMLIMVRFFMQIWFRTLSNIKLFGLLPINTSLLIPWGYEITLISLRDLTFFREDLLEKKPKVSYHSRYLIQGFDIWILVWRPSFLWQGWSDPLEQLKVVALWMWIKL